MTMVNRNWALSVTIVIVIVQAVFLWADRFGDSTKRYICGVNEAKIIKSESSASSVLRVNDKPETKTEDKRKPEKDTTVEEKAEKTDETKKKASEKPKKQEDTISEASPPPNKNDMYSKPPEKNIIYPDEFEGVRTRPFEPWQRNQSYYGRRPVVDFGGSPWCPNALCQNSDLCHPCHRRFLILLATARSASTTLTYMFDALPGIRMSGENNDELKAIRIMINNIQSSENFRNSVSSKSAWGHNRVPSGAYACVAQHMIETINPPLTDSNGTVLENDLETIVGFKTIRFLNGITEEDTKDLVLWVQETFPCARILVNIRSNVEEQAASRQKASIRGPGDPDSLKQANAQMRRVAKLFGDQAYLLDSSDWLNDIRHLNQAVEWLGFHKSCFFTELLEFNTKGRGYDSGRSKLELHPDCHYIL